MSLGADNPVFVRLVEFNCIIVEVNSDFPKFSEGSLPEQKRGLDVINNCSLYIVKSYVANLYGTQ